MIRKIKSEMMLHRDVFERTFNDLQSHILTASIIAVDTLKKGNKIIFCGNGGSAADAQHMAAEFVGRYKSERKGLPAIAITADTSVLSAIGNDYGFENVFSRQIEALANKGDLLMAISTSGNSKNVLLAIKKSKELGCRVVGLSGRDGGGMNEICDLNIAIPSNDTARIQEMHILIGHVIAQVVDDAFEVE